MSQGLNKIHEDGIQPGRASSRSAGDAAGRVVHLIETVTRAPSPVRIRAWDGSEAGVSDAVIAITLNSPRAIRHLLWQPNELGAARAYVCGDADLEGPAGRSLADSLADPRLGSIVNLNRSTGLRRLLIATQTAHLALRLAGLGTRPAPPPEEASLHGRRHRRRRDAAAISHHYDVSNDFYRLLLGETMVYSCAYWKADPGPMYNVLDAQQDKLDLVCGKLGLARGDRLLDVGCGWGALVLHAAREYGVRAVGVTVSAAQEIIARQRVQDAGLASRVEIRRCDYRDIDDGPYDSIASVGMAEHVGRHRFREYAEQISNLLAPGGRLLQHQITTPRPRPRDTGRFISRYIFPDGDLRPLSEIIAWLEHAGLETCDLEALRPHYALTLRAWLDRLEHDWPATVELTSPARARAWRLYLAGSAAAFTTGRIGVHQIVAIKPTRSAVYPLPRLRSDWLPVSGSSRVHRMPSAPNSGRH